MDDHLEARGKIEVAQAAIASIVSEAVQTCRCRGYGATQFRDGARRYTLD